MEGKQPISLINIYHQDALELSDDSDIEVHPNVDKRSFIRAKQNQIHMEREQRKRQIQALKYERVINDALMQRLSVLTSALQSRHAGSAQASLNPADIAFQAMMELASANPEKDNPPPRPEGVFDSPPLPNYSKMLASLLDEVNRTLDERGVGEGQRLEAFSQELGVHAQKIQGLQAELVTKLEALEQQDSNKITSEGYHVGFDSSHVNKSKPGETSKQETGADLPNPNHNPNNETKPATLKTTTPTAENPEATTPQNTRASPQAQAFAQTPASSPHASRTYLQSHPALLQQESATDGLLFEAYCTLLHDNDETLARQYTHQALLLQYCRLLGGGSSSDGVALFFKRVTTPGHQAREGFERDVAETFRGLCAMAKRDAEKREGGGGSEGVAQVQLLCPGAGRDGLARVWVPPVGSEDGGVRRAREIFEGFSAEMRAALERGSLEEVNEVLAGMEVAEAERTAGLLNEVSSCCLS